VFADSDIPYTRIDALKWIEQAAAALAYMHAVQPQPTLHRDLKPANILLFHNHTIAKLADFGLARVMSGPTLTKNVGTQSYMAPEVRNFSNLIGHI
jgi:serine/threonine protein kinase